MEHNKITKTIDFNLERLRKLADSCDLVGLQQIHSKIYQAVGYIHEANITLKTIKSLTPEPLSKEELCKL